MLADKEAKPFISHDIVSQRLHASMQGWLRVGDGKVMDVTVSIGVAAYNGHPDYERIIKDADDALYRAKKGGRNRCELAD